MKKQSYIWFMTDHNALQFRQLDYTGLETLVKWAIYEGWNSGPHDAKAFWETDPKGFYGCYKDDELIGGGSIVSYNGDFGFMGFFIVKPAYRAMGIGRKLWHLRRDTLLSRLKANAPIGMDGVVAMQDFYEKGGFKTAFRDLRYEKMGQQFELHPAISSITKDDLQNVLALDKECFGYARPQFMEHWLKLPDSKTFKYSDENGLLKGFAMIRKVNVGYKVCPLFAENKAIAEELYKACLNGAAGELLYLDIPMANPMALELVEAYEATYVFECARMYLGEAPKMNLQKVFGITTFELG